MIVRRLATALTGLIVAGTLAGPSAHAVELTRGCDAIASLGNATTLYLTEVRVLGDDIPAARKKQVTKNYRRALRNAELAVIEAQAAWPRGFAQAWTLYYRGRQANQGTSGYEQAGKFVLDTTLRKCGFVPAGPLVP